MAKRKKQEQSSGPIKLIPIPGGRYEQFLHRKRQKEIRQIPKDSYDYLTTLVDINGSVNIEDMSEVGVGDYTLSKGLIHAMNMNVGRQIPWIEDGLKSVERRALYAMWVGGYYGNKSIKVASVVGAMIEKYYPHGDRAPADTIYRLGRSKTMMLPYVRPKGNYGNMQDLEPAASRYAEASLSDYARDCFFGDIGPRRPLYDERDTYEYTSKEPIYLISRYPNILMQWNLGIGKGAASWLGAFNSIELMKATLDLMKDPNAVIDIYPDAPVPVNIVNKDELAGCFDRAKFKVMMRAPYHTIVDQRRSGNKIEDKLAIVFTALPLGVVGNQIADEITRIKKDEAKKASKRLPEVLNVEIAVDDVSPGGIEIIVEYERGYDPHVLAEKLYKSTSLGKTIGVNYNLIIDNMPVVKTPREILLIWINQRYDQKRRYFHQLVIQSAIDRATYDALVMVLSTSDATDKAIALIRKSKDKTAAIEALQKAFSMTNFQARQVIKIPLGNLSKMSITEVIQKRDEAIKSYKHYRKMLSDDGSIQKAVYDEVVAGMKKYGKPRVANLMNLESEGVGSDTDTKYLIYNSEYYFCVDKPEDLPGIIDSLNNTYQMVQVQNSDNVLVFTRAGKLKILNGYAFNLTDTGIAVSTLGIKDIASIVNGNPTREYMDLVMVTEQGYGKRISFAEATKSVKSSVINLSTGDSLAAVIPVKTNNHPDSIIGMIQGDKMYYLRLDSFPVYKRASAGNRLIKGVKDLQITGAVYFDATDGSNYMLIYGESGYIKLLDMAFLSFAKRGNNSVSLQGKKIIGAALIHGKPKALSNHDPEADTRSEFDDSVMLYWGKGKLEINLQIGKTVLFKAATGETQKFKMSTSIGSPVKVLKVSKNEWYHIQ